MIGWLKIIGPIVLVIAVYLTGRHDGASIEQAAQARADRAAASASRTAQSKIDSLTSDAAKAEQGRQANVREIRHDTERVIERPVYRNLCVDSDGMQLIARAAANANGAGEPVAAGAAAGSAGSAGQP